MPVEDADRLRAVGQWAHPYFNRTYGTDAISLFSGPILINRDNIFVSKQGDGLRRHRRKIVSRKQRCGKDRPQAHVGPILVGVHTAVADLEHIRIVPMSRTCKASQSSLAKPDRLHSRVVIVDVAGGAPEIATHALA